ncbi:hypothetical protein ACFU7Y_16600 [Kitasatospora sp. NPDC057542]|uniref:hypothetical protein n=1 Tax=Kitasatospora sp. NPDC057542 TaxID=3346162 RepID=UPI0036D0772A
MSGSHSQPNPARRRWRLAFAFAVLIGFAGLIAMIFWAPLERAQLLVALISAPLASVVIATADHLRSNRRED